MREVALTLVTRAVRELCISANVCLSPDLERAVKQGEELERSPLGKSVFRTLVQNMAAAKETSIPLCQDTGMAVVFCEIGQEVHFTGGSFKEAVCEGVRRGYEDGCLRCSVVEDPLRRKNTGDNTPPVIHTELVPGDRVKLTVMPKGFGSENMSAVSMFNPSVPRDDIVGFVVNTVKKAGSKPCPPMVIGVGIGGTFEYCTYLSKKALLRAVDEPNPDPFYGELEREMLAAVNQTGIGPQGFGGTVTALSVMIEHFPTHIASLPVAVNIGCHITRHATKIV